LRQENLSLVKSTDVSLFAKLLKRGLRAREEFLTGKHEADEIPEGRGGQNDGITKFPKLTELLRGEFLTGLTRLRGLGRVSLRSRVGFVGRKSSS
jgi:hypothetical protein